MAKVTLIKQGSGGGGGGVTSVGLVMPSGFSVTNSPVTGSGSLTVTGAGDNTQYINGDGELATLPTVSEDILIAESGLNISSLAASLTGIVCVDKPQVDTITCANLTAILGLLRVQNCSFLTDISLGSLQTTGDVCVVSSNPLLTILDLGSLTTVTGYLALEVNYLLSSLDLSSLVSVSEYINITANNSITALDLSALTSVGGNFTITSNPSLLSIDLSALATTSYQINISDNVQLTSLNLLALTNCGGSIGVFRNNDLTSISLDNLISSGDIDFSFNASLTTVDLSNLNTCTGDNKTVAINDCPSLTSVTLNSAIDALNIYFPNCALTQASVDAILLAVDTAGFSDGFLYLSGGTSSAPTGGFLNANYVSLVGKGWQVQIN